MSLAKENIDVLVSRCDAGDARAQAEIYKRYSGAMYNVARRIVRDDHFAEDVMQEGFLRAFNKISDYRREVAFGAWLKRIIINQSIDFYKKRSAFASEDIDHVLYKVEDEAPEENSDFTKLRANQVLAAMQDLKDNYRALLTLHYIEGYDHEEITEIMNISYANCRTMMSRAKDSLRQKLVQQN